MAQKTLHRVNFGPVTVQSSEDLEALLALAQAPQKRGGKKLALSHITFTVVPSATKPKPSKKSAVSKPAVAFYYAYDWSGISFWF